jgi:RNA polymerase sigma-70 factor (ECF subfamily)
MRPNPVVALNRAVAVGSLHGPSAGLDALAQVQLEDYQPYHAARADLLARAGCTDEAVAAYGQAIQLTNDSVRRGCAWRVASTDQRAPTVTRRWRGLSRT